MVSKYHFSTIVSRTHIFKLMPMIHSLHEHCRDFHLYVLCVDLKAYELLQQVPWEHVTAVQLHEMEDPELLEAKGGRTFHEYCWTLKPAFLFHVMTEYNEAEYFAHLDTDLFFFSDVDRLFAEKPDASLFLTDHRNSKRFASYYKLTGQYNTGFVGARNTEEAYRAVWQWRQDCISYCTVEMNEEKRHTVIKGMLKSGPRNLNTSMSRSRSARMRRCGILRNIKSACVTELYMSMTPR